MTQVDPEHCSFDAQRMARSRRGEGIRPAEASIVANNFARCPNCEAELDLEVTNGRYEDRDTVWRDDVFGSAPYTCTGCHTTFNVLVEEKAFGVISEAQVPDEPHDDVYFVPVPESEAVIVVNTHQIMLTEHTIGEEED